MSLNTDDPKFGDIPKWAQKEILFAYQRWYVAHQAAMVVLIPENRMGLPESREGTRLAVAVVRAHRQYVGLLDRFLPPGYGLTEVPPPPTK